jgi:hypothetical protein
MTLTGVLLGVINAAIVVAIIILVGAIIVWLAGLMQIVIPHDVRRMFLVVVALIGLYLIVALLLGMPTIHVISAPAPAI